MKAYTYLLTGVIAAALIAAPAAAQPKRDTKPGPTGPAPTLTVPAVKRLALANGLPVYYISKPELPLAQVTLVLRSGAIADPAGDEGLAAFTAALMREAAGDRDVKAFADAVEFLGINLSSGASTELSSVVLSTPLRQLTPGLALMADLVTRPRFDASDFERLKKRQLTQLISQRDQPGPIASVAFAKQLFGATHPYGRPTQGLYGTVSGFTLDKVKAYWKQHYTPANAYVIIAGQLTEAEALRQLEASLGKWTGGAAPAPVAIAPAKAPKGRTIYLVDRPGSAQSQVLVGHVGLSRTTPDYHAAEVVNTLLGASFTSRLNSNLREKNGYSYGARSAFQYRLQPGPFVAQSAVETSVTDKAVREFLNELKAIRTITPAELDKTRNYVALSYPADFEGVGGISAQVSSRIFYGLPDDSFDSFIPTVLGVTPQQAAAAAKRIDPDNLIIVIVGDAAKIEGPLKAQKFGQLVKLSIADVLGPPPAQ